ncbi:MAG: hypothetical protein PHN64_01120 [Desulfovibrionaceae bacterium]|nr:hypothetical protein [Desulfovibrionaceae bacterium]
MNMDDYLFPFEVEEEERKQERIRNRIITSEKMITLPELCNRWRGATETEILIEESSGRLLPYMCDS